MARDTAQLTVTQVAQMVGVNPATVRRWITAGKLPALCTPGGHYRVNELEARRLTSNAA